MKSRPLLDGISGPADLRRLAAEHLPALAAEIRAEIIDVVSGTGGHLASNLGTVELTLALMRVFDVDTDRVVWDTGHQCYAYKLLTGRRASFQNLRQADGCSGFPLRDESRYDVFGTGHAGTAISAALGLAVARDVAGETRRVIAVVGDGALGSGVALEGLNSIIEKTRDFILVVNDNKMAIAPRVGAIGRYLNRVISGERYNRIKRVLRNAVLRIPRIGAPMRQAISRLEELTKGILVPGLVFEELGLRYFGPIDGHNLPLLQQTFEAVRGMRMPVVVHVLTEKGHGYAKAEAAPELFHGVSRPAPPSELDVQYKKDPHAPPGPTFSSTLGEILVSAVAANPRVMAITAGMCHGTGLVPLREKHPDNLIDVGIAEEHAVVFAAGLATAGYRPVVAIYATFMQRAMDYVLHDVCLQRLPVIFCLDRAGVVEDGPTHHGIHDVGYWRGLPDLPILQPADTWDMEAMFILLLARGSAGMLRYPRGSSVNLDVPERAPMAWGKAEVLRPGRQVAIWAVGREVAVALDLARMLATRDVEACVVNTRFLVPFDAALFLAHAAAMPVVTLENHVLVGGLASLAAETVAASGKPARLLHRGWPNSVLPWGQESDIRQRCRLDTPSLADDIAAFARA